MRTLILAALLSVLLSGCGRLMVQVDALSPDYLEQKAEQPFLYRALHTVLGQSKDFVEQTFARQWAEHQRFLRIEAGKYWTVAKGQPDGSPARATLEAVAKSIDDGAADTKNYYDKAKGEVLSYNERIQLAYQALGQNSRIAIENRLQPVPGSIGAILWERRSRLRTLGDFVTEEVGRSGMNAGQLLEGNEQRSLVREAGNFAVVSQTNLGALTGTTSLTEDPVAFAVAAAPDGAWATKFNEAYARGSFGQVDIAIKLNRPGDFTIKGLLFDPSTVAQVASKSITQALLLLAQVNGVPVSIESPSGNGTALAGTSALLAQSQASTAERRAAIRNSNQALFALADAVVREEGNLADPNRIVPAVDAVKLMFDKHQDRINPSAATK